MVGTVHDTASDLSPSSDAASTVGALGFPGGSSTSLTAMSTDTVSVREPSLALTVTS